MGGALVVEISSLQRRHFRVFHRFRSRKDQKMAKMPNFRGKYLDHQATPHHETYIDGFVRSSSFTLYNSFAKILAVGGGVFFRKTCMFIIFHSSMIIALTTLKFCVHNHSISMYIFPYYMFPHCQVSSHSMTSTRGGLLFIAPLYFRGMPPYNISLWVCRRSQATGRRRASGRRSSFEKL